MFRLVLWFFIVVLTAWLIWRRFRKGSWMAVLGLIFGMAAAVYLGLALLLLVFQSRLVYMPLREVELTPAHIGLVYEAVRIDTPDGQTLAGWYLPVDGAELTVLFCHGNAGNIGHRLDTLAVFHDLGLNCLIFDYRGYGASTGRPSEEGTIIDALACRRWLVENRQIRPETILFFGRSLGGAVAAIAAARSEPAAAGLVLESTFTSVPDLGAHLYPWLPVRLFARYGYDVREALQEIDCPVAILHSPEDELIPFDMGRQLYDSAREPKWFGELKGTHNEGFFDHMTLYRRLWSEILIFVQTTR